MESFDLIIIGSGISGLTLANETAKISPDLQITILEKAPGVGGRMATRRGEQTRFDHGAQFYRLTPEIAELHSKWLHSGAGTSWFTNASGAHFRGSDGMTTLAKVLATAIDIRLKTKVVSISIKPNGVELRTDTGDTFETKRAVLTAPLPQSLELLNASGIPFREDLSTIRYATALIALASFDRSPPFPNAWGYIEPADTEVFSVTDQKRKGISANPAWSVCFSPAWSARNFHKPDAEIGSEMARLIQDRYGFYPSSLQVKKWRYSHPLSVGAKLFEEVIPGKLFLCGDAFGGPSLSGAVRSARALAAQK